LAGAQQHGRIALRQVFIGGAQQDVDEGIAVWIGSFAGDDGKAGALPWRLVVAEGRLLCICAAGG
jgi:hypothetical protein